MVATTKLKLKHAGANPTEGIFVTCLNVGSLLKKLFFMHKQSLPQQQTSPNNVPRPNAPPPAPELSVFSSNHAPRFIGPIRCKISPDSGGGGRLNIKYMHSNSLHFLTALVAHYLPPFHCTPQPICSRHILCPCCRCAPGSPPGILLSCTLGRNRAKLPCRHTAWGAAHTHAHLASCCSHFSAHFYLFTLY